MRQHREYVTVILLLIAVGAIAALMAARGAATWLEAISFVTGAMCVWLTVKENVWNFPISLVNVATFCVIFFNVQLYADAGLQVVYFLLTLIGWHLWLFGGPRRTTLQVSRISLAESYALAAFGLVTTLGLWQLLHHVGGSASFWDALTTSISLCAQWLLNRKKVESWYCWIAVDVIYIPLYLYKDLYLTSLLYAVFLVMATIGLFRWTATWKAQSSTEQPRPTSSMNADVEAGVMTS